MSPKQKVEEPRFGRYYAQGSSSLAFSTRTILLVGFPLILTNLTLDYGRAPGTFLQWLLVAVVGYLVLAAMMLIARVALNSVTLPRALYLPLYYVMGLIRGGVIFLIAHGLDLIPSSELIYRVLGSATYVFCVIPIATILMSNFNRASQTLKSLQAQTLRRSKRLNSMKVEIAEQKAEIAGRVSGLLTPVISELMQRVNATKSSDIGKQISALRNTVDNVVRPLSHSVAQEGNQLSDPQVQLDRVNFMQRLNPNAKLDVSQLYLPGLSTFLLTLMCLSPIITFGGTEIGVVILAVIAVTTFASLTVLKRLTRKLSLSAVPAAALLIASYGFITLFSIGTIALMRPDLLAISAPRLISLNMLFGLVFFIAQSRYQLLHQASASLEEVNRELELLNAQAKQELWLNRRRIATVLHGPVQAALYASAIRLAQSKRPSKKLLQDVNSDLALALDALSFDKNEATSVRALIREIIDVWSGVCEIDFNVPKAVYDLTKRNSNAAESFVEIIREAISNAIKHGGATEIEVTAKLDKGIIRLSVMNNGKVPTQAEASTGYGTQILNELALAWNLETSAENEVLFTADIVC